MRRVSYSQTGQDILADFLLRRMKKIPSDPGFVGAYVDVGAFHPVADSNTNFFYERGWSGLCIDANPAAAKAFQEMRPRDIFSQVGIADHAEESDFHVYSNGQWSSFNRPPTEPHLVELYVGTIKIRTVPLSEVIDSSPLSGKMIDLMNIDTEGHEYKVLKSLDFSRHAPSLIIMESIRSPLDASGDEALQFVLGKGYTLAAHTGHDAFLVRT